MMTALVHVGTLPYYRFYYFNTLGVLQRIAIVAQNPSDFPKLLSLLKHWRLRKLSELQFISIAVSPTRQMISVTLGTDNTVLCPRRSGHWLFFLVQHHRCLLAGFSMLVREPCTVDTGNPACRTTDLGLPLSGCHSWNRLEDRAYNARPL
jgi:hypothetical protein